jgi:putative hydrolase of the HAD superfamily
MGSENDHRRGLLVDYGGVLTSNLFDSFRLFCVGAGIEPDSVVQRFREHPTCRELLVELETGRLPEAAFEPRFAGILGVPAEGLIDGLFAGSEPDEAMCAAVIRARQAGVATGLVSNSWGTRRYDRERLAEMFDAIVISGEVGIRKPAPEIYLMGAERIGIDASECVFVDDLPFNLEPAAELGMATVHHVSADETAAALEALLGVPLR